MSITSAREIWEGRTAKIDDKGHREYTREFRLTTDTDLQDSASICLSPLFPPLYTPYVVPNGVDNGALLNSISAAQDQGEPTVWKVTLHYSTKTPNSSRHPGNPNPTNSSDLSNSPFDRPPLVTWDAVQYTRPFVTDITDIFNPKAVCNSAGQRFDPPVEIDDSRMVLIYERNEISFNRDAAKIYRDALNSDVWNGFDIGTVKCCKIAANLEFEKGIYYWKVRYEFHIRDDWSVKVLDHGPCQLNGDSPPVLVHMYDKGRVLTTDMLDGSGHQLAYTTTPSDRFKNAKFLKFSAYISLPFGPLGIFVPG